MQLIGLKVSVAGDLKSQEVSQEALTTPHHIEISYDPYLYFKNMLYEN